MSPKCPSSDFNGICDFNNPSRQDFPFSSPIVRYIFTNAKSYGKTWKKLIQTCKYFFSKFSVYPIAKLTVRRKKWDFDGQIFDSNKVVPKKLWLCNEFDYSYHFRDDVYTVSKFISKIYKCNLKTLNIEYQHLLWNDYKILTTLGSFVSLRFEFCFIHNYDGTTVTLDKLLENICYVESFTFWCSNDPSLFQSDTVMKVLKILSEMKYMQRFELFGLDESFDFVTFKDFLVNNNSMNVMLIFEKNLQHGYKQMIQNFVDKLLLLNSSKIFPYISLDNSKSFYGYEEYKKLKNIREVDSYLPLSSFSKSNTVFLLPKLKDLTIEFDVNANGIFDVKITILESVDENSVTQSFDDTKNFPIVTFYKDVISIEVFKNGKYVTIKNNFGSETTQLFVSLKNPEPVIGYEALKDFEVDPDYVFYDLIKIITTNDRDPDWPFSITKKENDKFITLKTHNGIYEADLGFFMSIIIKWVKFEIKKAINQEPREIEVEFKEIKESMKLKEIVTNACKVHDLKAIYPNRNIFSWYLQTMFSKDKYKIKKVRSMST